MVVFKGPKYLKDDYVMGLMISFNYNYIDMVIWIFMLESVRSISIRSWKTQLDESNSE